MTQPTELPPETPPVKVRKPRVVGKKPPPGPFIIKGRPHHLCCVQFCKAPSLLKPGRSTGSAGCWERFCGNHLPKNAVQTVERLATFSAEGAAKRVQVMAERRERLVKHQATVNYATGPESYGEMAPSEDREKRGWGLVAHGALHYFTKGSGRSLCGRIFAENQPVSPNFGPPQCAVCLSTALFTDKAVR